MNHRIRVRLGVAAAAIAAALVFLLAGAASLGAGGQREAGEGSAVNGTAAERNGVPGSVEPDRGSRQMRRLASVGAGLSTRGGTAVPVELPEKYQDQTPPAGHRQFSTDFSRAAVSYEEIIAGGPPKDGIPAIDRPRFEPAADADAWLGPDEAVIAVTADGETHLYPLQILMWHEIVNDTVGSTPLTVTYCPLCNTGIVFERTFDGQLMDFGVSGMLIYSNMIMYDRQTETWWVQATGRGIAGEHAGQQLAFYPSTLIPWREARTLYPQARVLSRHTGHRRDYGRNPYGGYDRAARPFLYRGPDVVSAQENPMTRVLSVYHEDKVIAFDFPLLQEERIVEQTVGGASIVVFWEPGTASALDSATVGGGRDVGTANAFYPVVNGRVLRFEYHEGQIIDTDTGSRWNVAGHAVSGRLQGARMEPALSVHHFLFSWRAFHP